MNNEAVKIEKENMAVTFHTCLRKCVDSRGASIAWLAVDLLSKEVWHNFIDRLYRKKINLENCLDSIHITRDDQQNGIHRTSDVILFTIGLEMIGDNYINKPGKD